MMDVGRRAESDVLSASALTQLEPSASLRLFVPHVTLQPVSELWTTTIPGYATGGGTVLLAVATAGLLYLDRKNRLREALRGAHKVFAIAEERDAPRSSIAPSASLNFKLQVITIINAGPDPIFDAGGDASIPKTEGHPGSIWQHGLHQNNLSFVLPNERASLHGQWGNFTDEGVFAREELPYWAYEQVPISIWWTDSGGRRWRRDGRSEPVPVDGSHRQGLLRRRVRDRSYRAE